MSKKATFIIIDSSGNQNTITCDNFYWSENGCHQFYNILDDEEVETVALFFYPVSVIKESARK